MNFVRDKTKQNLVGEKKSFAFDYQRNEKASKRWIGIKVFDGVKSQPDRFKFFVTFYDFLSCRSGGTAWGRFNKEKNEGFEMTN